MIDNKFIYPDRIIKKTLMVSVMTSALLFFSGVSYAADSGNGERLYAVNCALCHGVRGVGVMFGEPIFARGEGLLQADRAILSAIQNGKNEMPAYQGILSDTEILDVMAYLHTLY